MVSDELQRLEKDKETMAFDEVMCSDRYIMLQAVLCNESLTRKCPLEFFHFDFPHLTCCRLATSQPDRRAGRWIWNCAEKEGYGQPIVCTLEISDALKRINDFLCANGYFHKLFTAHIWLNSAGGRYEIESGPALDVYRLVQSMLRDEFQMAPSKAIDWWCEGEHPVHITYSYVKKVQDTAVAEATKLKVDSRSIKDQLEGQDHASSSHDWTFVNHHDGSLGRMD